MPILLRNGRIHTGSTGGDARRPPPSALLIADDRLAWVGDEADAAAATGRAGTVTVDLAGRLVTPAFVDAHVHVTATGLQRTGLDLARCRSLAEALDAVATAARTSRGRPVLGGGWDETAWPEGRPPSAAELDRAAYGGLVYLTRVDLHSAVASSALLRAVPALLGPGGGLARRPGVGADGWIREPAHDALREVALSALTAGQRRDAQRAALRAAAALGIACVHEMAGPVISGEDDFVELLALGAADGDGEALPEVIGYWGELGAVAKAAELGAIGAAGDLFCDGSLGSATAALGEPYAGTADDRGLLHHATAELVEHVSACVAAGLQAGFHAIGDAAVDQVLTVFEQVPARPGAGLGAAGPAHGSAPASAHGSTHGSTHGRAHGSAQGRAHRIEHAEYVRDPTRLARSGLTASMQPCFDALWGGPDGMYAQRLGADRALALNRVGELAAAGVPLAFGSDSPVTDLGPWDAVHAATRHHDPAASLDPVAAFAAHTEGGWRAADRTAEGPLVAGRPATFAVWDAVLEAGATLPDLDAGRPACVATVRAGRVLHDMGLLAGTFGARPA